MHGFESAYVLSSDDGVTYSSSVPLPKPGLSIDDLIQQRRSAAAQQRDNQSFRSLREQLRENKERQEAEWKEKNNPFRPPPSMTAEDVELMNEQEQQKQQQRRREMEQREKDRLEFIQARRKAEKEKDNKQRREAQVEQPTQDRSQYDDQQKSRNSTTQKVVVVKTKKKRKQPSDSTTGDVGLISKSSRTSHNSEHSKTVNDNSVPRTCPSPSVPDGRGLSTLLQSYSDDD